MCVDLMAQTLRWGQQITKHAKKKGNQRRLLFLEGSLKSYSKHNEAEIIKMEQLKMNATD